MQVKVRDFKSFMVHGSGIDVPGACTGYVDANIRSIFIFFFYILTVPNVGFRGEEEIN